jgi:O-antigen/teichoic acid export membrane protein
MKWLLHPERLRFARDSVLMIVSSALSGLFYLLVHVFVGRLLGKVEYGQLVALLGLLNVINLPSSTARIVLARFVAEYAHGNATQLWVTVVKRAVRRITLWGIVALLLWSLLSTVIRDVLHAPSASSIVILGGIAFAMLYSPILQGTLQGARFFGWLAAAGLAGSGGRLLFTSAAAAGVGSVTSVLVAVLLSVLFALAVSYWRFHAVLRTTPRLDRFDTRPMYRYMWPVLFGQGALFILMNADLILSARFLPESDLAIYGYAAMLSRTVLFLPQPIALAMFPRAVNSRNPWLLIGPLAFSLVVGLAAAGFIFTVPDLPMRLMYGVTDASCLALVRRYVWAAIPLSLCAIVAQYLWARHATIRMLVLIPVALAYIAGLFLFHAEPTQMVVCLAAGSTAALLAMAGAAFTLHLKGHAPGERVKRQLQ